MKHFLINFGISLNVMCELFSEQYHWGWIRYASFLALSTKGWFSAPDRFSAHFTCCCQGRLGAQCVWGHQGCHQIHHLQMSCLRTTWASQTKGFFFLQSHSLDGKDLELSKIGCALVFGPMPFILLLKPFNFEGNTISHYQIHRNTRL